jgi:transcriptional regulator
MYLRPIHAEHDIPTLRHLITETKLGILVTAVPSSGNPLLQSTHIPWTLHLDDPSSTTEYGTLRGHMAKQNPQARTLVSAVDQSMDWKTEQEVMVLFTLPADHYISPQYYTDTKPRTGKVVPTWNYASVTAYGHLKVYDPSNPSTTAFLESQMDALTHTCETSERSLEGEWKVSDAPDSYVAALRKAVIGVEIVVERLEGKWKMSQEMGVGDREGIVRGLRRAGERGEVVAEMVQERGGRKK